MVRCTVRLSSRACAQISSEATRYKTSASVSVLATAPKSTPRPGTTFMPDSRSAKALSPRARAAAMACALVIPAGSCRPMTPLNSRSVAWPRMRGTTTPITVPVIPSVITVMLIRRCGASRFTSRAAEPQKSRDRPVGAGAGKPRGSRVVATVIARPRLDLIARRPPTASRRTPHRWRSRPAAIHGCPNPPVSRHRPRLPGRPGLRSKYVG